MIKMKKEKIGKNNKTKLKLKTKNSFKEGFFNSLSDLKSNIVNLLLSFVVILVVIFAIYHNESFGIVFKLVVGLFYLFILPGFFFVLTLKKLGFLSRIVLAYLIGLGLTTVTTYSLNIFFKIKVFSFYYYWPLFWIVVGFSYYVYRFENNK